MKQYWSVGLGFEYDIESIEPDECKYSSFDGPFKTLKEAQKQVREWIKSDRSHLSNVLARINSLKDKEV